MGCCPGKKSNPPSSSCGSTCFRVKNITVDCTTDGTGGPCGGTFSKDIAALNTTLNACTEGGSPCTKTYQLLSFDSTFDSVTLSSDGTGLTGVISDTANGGDVGIIRYRVLCDCNGYAGNATVKVCIENLCADTVPEDGMECNKCTGENEPIVPNAILS